MTYRQIATMIAGVGVPYAYYQFPEGTAQAPPFICFYYDSDNDIKADQSNYQKVERLVIELYTAKKDFELEAATEAALKAAGLVYSRNEVFIDSEKLYQDVFETDVLINEEV